MSSRVQQATSAPAVSTTRSPPESPRESFSTSPPLGGRRYSLNLPPSVIQQLEKRRASLDRMQLDKISPWMHLYDFTEAEASEEKDGE